MLLRLLVSFLLLVLVLAAKSAAAQPLRPLESICTDMPGELQSLQIHGDIAGSMVETTVRMVFLNPIPGMKTRTIASIYTETMTREGKSWAYRLPLACKGAVRDFKLSVTIRGSGDVPVVSGMFGSLRLDRDARGFFFHVEKSDFTADGVMDIAIPTAQHALTYVQQYRGETYFVAEIPMAPSRSPRSQVRSVNADGATAIVVDAADAEQGLVRVAGKLRNASAMVDLQIIGQGDPKEMHIAVSAGDPQHPMVAQLWAAYRLRASPEKW